MVKCCNRASTDWVKDMMWMKSVVERVPVSWVKCCQFQSLENRCLCWHKLFTMPQSVWWLAGSSKGSIVSGFHKSLLLVDSCDEWQCDAVDLMAQMSCCRCRLINIAGNRVACFFLHKCNVEVVNGVLTMHHHFPRTRWRRSSLVTRLQNSLGPTLGKSRRNRGNYYSAPFPPPPASLCLMIIILARFYFPQGKPLSPLWYVLSCSVCLVLLLFLLCLFVATGSFSCLLSWKYANICCYKLGSFFFFFFVQLSLNSKEMMVGRCYVQLAAIWHWHLPLCIYNVFYCVCPFL